MVLNVQGSGYTLSDPEIASAQLMDADDKILFCSGNLFYAAIEGFLANHKCNHYCSLLGLSEK